LVNTANKSRHLHFYIITHIARQGNCEPEFLVRANEPIGGLPAASEIGWLDSKTFPRQEPPERATLDLDCRLSYKVVMTRLEKNLNGSTWWRGRFLPRLPLG
jgi:hypothetical protein